MAEQVGEQTSTVLDSYTRVLSEWRGRGSLDAEAEIRKSRENAAGRSSSAGRQVHDPVDIRRRIERLAARVDRRDDYGQLLARGDVIHRVEDIDDVDAWRAEIKRQARADKIKVRTGVNEHIVWAVRLRPEQPGWQDEVRRYSDLLSRAVPLAVDLRHEPAVAFRDGDEVVCACERCDALGSGNDSEEIIGGTLFEDECPHEEPPTLTGLAMMFVPRSRWPS